MVVEAVAAAFVGGFQQNDAALVDGVEGARDGFFRLGGVMDGDGAEFGDVEELVCAATKRGPGVDGGAVREGGFGGAYVAAFHFFLEPCADEGDLFVFVRGVLRKVVEVVVGEFDFGELLFGLWCGTVYYSGCVVGGKEAHVEDEQGGVCGEAKLACLEDVVVVVEAAVDFLLRPVEAEAVDFAFFVDDVVEVVQPPVTVGEEGFECGVLFRCQLHNQFSILNVFHSS